MREAYFIGKFSSLQSRKNLLNKRISEAQILKNHKSQITTEDVVSCLPDIYFAALPEELAEGTEIT